MEKETGGTAFPLPLGSETVEGQEGMTLRDYFAAKAINGILSDPDAGLLDEDLERYAAISYRLADAMLRARGQ